MSGNQHSCGDGVIYVETGAWLPSRLSYASKVTPLHLLLIALTWGNLFVSAGRVGGGTLENFQDFVSQPPTVSEIVFEYRDATDPSSTENFYFARWQTNAFFLRCFHTLDELKNANQTPVFRAAGYCDDSFWIYSEDSGLKRYTRTPESRLGEFTNGVVQVCLQNLDLLSQVMNGGVPNQPVGSLSWDGLNLKPSAVSSAGFVWSGGLELAPDGSALGMRLFAKAVNSNEKYEHILNYQWDDTIKYLPSAIQHFSVTTNGIRRNWETINVIKLGTTNVLLDDNEFSPGRLTFSNKREWLYTNGQIYLALAPSKPFERVKYVLPGSSDDPVAQEKREGRAVVVGVIAFISLLFCAVIYRTLKKDRALSSER